MASFDNLLQPATIFLLFLTSSFSLHVHAREYKFFSKSSPYKASKDTSTAAPQETPLAAVEKEDPTRKSLPSQSRPHGYGLYGRGPDEFQTGTATTNNKLYNYNNDDVDARYKEFSTAENYVNKESSQGDGGNFHNYYVDDARDNAAGNFPTRASTNHQFINGASYAKREYSKTYPGDKGYEKEQFGMSDTRFLENGRYFYDVNAERYREGYDPTGEDGAYNYQHSARDGNYGYGGYSHGGKGSANGYSSEVGSNQLQREEQGSQEQYVP